MMQLLTHNKKITTTLFVVYIVCLGCCGQGMDVRKSLKGTWNCDKTAVFPIDPYHDKVIEAVETNEIVFTDDYVIIQSGLFYLTDEQWPEGHYPWRYCGSHTFYEIKNDSVRIYHPGYKVWKSFLITTVGEDSLILTSDNVKLFLSRKEEIRYKNNIKSIHLKVVHIEPFLIVFSVFIEDDRIKVENGHRVEKIISKGFTDYIFKNLNRVNISELETLYDSETSSNRILHLTTESYDGSKYYSKIIGRNHPDELKLALIPIIYAGDIIKHEEYRSGIIK